MGCGPATQTGAAEPGDTIVRSHSRRQSGDIPSIKLGARLLPSLLSLREQNSILPSHLKKLAPVMGILAFISCMVSFTWELKRELVADNAVYRLCLKGSLDSRRISL